MSGALDEARAWANATTENTGVVTFGDTVFAPENQDIDAKIDAEFARLADGLAENRANAELDEPIPFVVVQQPSAPEPVRRVNPIVTATLAAVLTIAAVVAGVVIW